MKKLVSTLLAILLMAPMIWAQSSVAPDRVIDAIKVDKSKSLKRMARRARRTKRRGRDYEIPNKPSLYAEKDRNVSHGIDQGLQRDAASQPAGPTIQTWEGVGRFTGGGGTPPDPNMDVGPNHVFQWVNTSFKIWDKSGNILMGPSPGNSFFSGFGGQCEFSNNGDPIVVYDELADRWMASQFASPGSPNALQCVAISTTPDPTGSYFRYSFATPGNDYPKLAVWPDAYYATIRNFAGGFQFDIYAFERDKMLVGAAAQVVVFNMSTVFPGSNNFLAADVDGTTPPPAGSPGYVMGLVNPSTPQTSLGLVEIDLDWSNTGNSTMTGPILVPVTPFDGNVCNFARPCIPQPGTNNKVDGFADALMHRLAYRNFGTHQAMVATHTVDVGDFNDHAGIRWYEFRNTGGGWSTHQDGTYSPDGDHRWMPSIAMDEDGNIAVGYSVSSKVTFPSLRYTGRRASDPLGQLTMAEGTIANGGGSQTGSQRWGDYSAMSVDPADGLTFWYTGEYYQTSSGSGWQTRVGSFLAEPLLDIVIDCSPDSPPVIIPTPGGGSFNYTIDVTNNTNSTQSVDVWVYAQRDGGGGTDPRFLQFDVSLGATSTTTFNVTETIPTVDAGNFTYNCKAGDIGTTTIINSSAFPVAVTPVEGAGRESIALEGSGWEGVAKASIFEEEGTAAPEAFSLGDNYPNPFNPTTNINYNLKEASHVKLSIYNTLGQEVKSLVNGFQSTGTQVAKWNATNSAGQAVSAGLYFYRLEANGLVVTKKMVLAK